MINGFYTGSVLVDSGVNYATMALEPGASRPSSSNCPDGPKDCTAAGYTITVYLGNPSTPLIYQVNTGSISAPPQHPTRGDHGL